MENREAIEWLKGCVVAYEVDNKGKPNGNVTCDLIQEVIDMAISALEKQEQDRWIPVKENPKKPERIFDTYQVYTKYERFGIADYFGGGGWSGYDVDGDQIDELEIAAWRPLPAPYQEDEA